LPIAVAAIQAMKNTSTLHQSNWADTTNTAINSIREKGKGKGKEKGKDRGKGIGVIEVIRLRTSGIKSDVLRRRSS
jgi:hypothetical protein